jgi:hypothetical protein
MNRNHVRRLRLKRETIRALQEDQLGAALGGITATARACFTEGPKPCCTTNPEFCSAGTWSGIDCPATSGCV